MDLLGCDTVVEVAKLPSGLVSWIVDYGKFMAHMAALLDKEQEKE